MYNKIYTAIMDLLTKRGDARYKYLSDTEDVAKILNINLDFDPLKIFGVNSIELGNGLPDLLLVYAEAPKGDNRAFYADTIFYKGRLTKIVLINALCMISDNDIKKYRHLAMIVRECALTILHVCAHYFNSASNRNVCSSTIGVYAGPVLFVKIADEYFGYNIMDEEKKKIHDYLTTLSIFVCNNIKPEYAQYSDILDPEKSPIVPSIRKAIDQVGIENLLDNSMYMGTFNVSYQGTNFMDTLLAVQDTLDNQEEQYTEQEDYTPLGERDEDEYDD